MPLESQLIPHRVSTILPCLPNGADLSMLCIVDAGGMYYCKSDRDGRNIRASEWFSTHLASHLGFATAPCSVIENEVGETFFGSLDQGSTAGVFEAKDFLTIPQKNELGQPSHWPGQYLAQLLAFDMFLNNPDRSIQNFILVSDGAQRRLCAIDFAAVRLADLSGHQFPVADSVTMTIGRAVRRTHGEFPGSMIEMVDRIAAIPLDTIRALTSGMPDDWLSGHQREGLCEHWASATIRDRLSTLRAGIEDGSLL